MKRVGKFAIVLGIIFIVSGLLATVLFFASFDWNNFDESDYFGYVNQTKNFSVYEINNVELNLVSEDITLEPISGEEFVFNLSGYYPRSESGEYPQLKLDESGNTLTVYIEYPQKRYIFGINSMESKIHVGIPKKYHENFRIDVVSGEVQIENVNFRNFKIESVSGNIEIRESDFFEGDFGTVSGEIFVYNSGNVTSIETVSGNVEIEDFEVIKDVRIGTVSGEVKLDLIENDSIDLEFESVSGNLENSFGNVYDGNYEVFVETTSGDLKVY